MVSPFAALTSVFCLMGAHGQSSCLKTFERVKAAVKAEKSAALEIVSKEVAAGSDCACEVVKAALEAASATPKVVAAIVEAAITAAPDKIEIISKCALAAAPDAAAEIKAVVDRLGKGKDTFNPLDFPGDNEYGPSANKESGTGESADSADSSGTSGGMFGGDGGSGLSGSGLFGGNGSGGAAPVFPPVIVNPPEATTANPTP